MITAERLRELLHYDLNTGAFTWRVALSTRTRVGDVAGYVKSSTREPSDGYRIIEIGGRKYSAHRLAFLYMTGERPAGIDHENRDPSDNRWCNLRPATQAQNMANTRVDANNSSGFKGVRKGCRKWYAIIPLNGKQVCLGSFDTRHQAYVAYALAASKHYGEYARVWNPDVMIEPGPQSIGNDFLGI